MPLYRGRSGSQIAGHATIDADRLEWAQQWRWSISSEGYACRGQRLPDGSYETRLLHRELLGLPVHGRPKVRFVDNTDRLNVTTANLRLSAQWVLQAVSRDPKLAALVTKKAAKARPTEVAA